MCLKACCNEVDDMERDFKNKFIYLLIQKNQYYCNINFANIVFVIQKNELKDRKKRR